MAFFHVPNHSGTRRSPCRRAASISPSTSAKSKRPSSGSINSHENGTNAVLQCSATSLSQMGAMYARLEELELCTSPASMMNGWPATISCVAVPALRMNGSCGVVSMLSSQPDQTPGV